MKKDSRFGYYYGTLINVTQNYNETDLVFHDFVDETKDMIKIMLDHGVVEIYFDVKDYNEGDEKYSDTMFFRTNDKTNFRELMTHLMPLRPHEFSEKSLHHFRMWFD